MTRERFVIGNWKMHTNVADAVVLATKLRNQLHEVSTDVTVVVCPPTVWLYPVAEVLQHAPNHLKLGAQNVWPGKDGRYTGETSAWMVTQMCQFAIVGHSERRVHQGEDNRLINQKVRSALRYGLRPILCLGEFRRLTADARGRLHPRRGDDASDIFLQLREGIAGLTADEVRRIVIAYEPVWAISGASGGRTADLHYVETLIGQLRADLDASLSEAVSSAVPMLYGGSVSAQTVGRFAHATHIDGLLVGSASTNGNEFLAIARNFHHPARTA